MSEELTPLDKARGALYLATILYVIIAVGIVIMEVFL
jgi:hypothetical protein